MSAIDSSMEPRKESFEEKELHAFLASGREKNAALAVRVGKLKEKLNDVKVGLVLSKGDRLLLQASIETLLSKPDNAQEVLREIKAGIWKEAEKLCDWQIMGGHLVQICGPKYHLEYETDLRKVFKAKAEAARRRE